MVQRLTADVTTRGSCTIVSLAGESDLASSEQLRNVLRTACETARHLIVDATRLRFMDSTGLGDLMDTHRRLREHGGKLIVAAPQPVVAKVLKISGLDKVFAIYSTLDTATASVSGGDADLS